MNTTITRSRWAAIGAAVAVTLGAGGIGLVSATSPDGAVAYVPIEPCRVTDTRAGEFNTGPRNTPIGQNETLAITAHGDNGDCTGIPTTSTGLQLNVTSLSATNGTFLTVWGAGDRPTASSLNPQPNQPPIPNAVTTGVTPTGVFNIYNAVGTVDVIVDIVGYYTDHQHSGADIIDESLTGADIEDGSVTGDDITDRSLTNVDIRDEPGIAFRNKNSSMEVVGTSASLVSTVSIQPPSDGFVTVQASADWYTGFVERQISCQLTEGTTTIDGSEVVVRDTSATAAPLAQSIALQQTFPVEAYFGLVNDGQRINLVCRSSAGTVDIDNIHMTAMFFPTSYAPAGFVIIGP